MANYFVNMPAPRAAGAVDFSPLNNAFANIGETNRYNALVERQSEQQQYQRGRDAKQDARTAQADSRVQAEMWGKRASAIDQLQGPQRAAAWQKVLSTIPDDGTRTPEELDPMTGPKMLMAEAGLFRDPRQDQAVDLDMQYKQAQIANMQANATNERSAYGKSGSIFLNPDTGRYEAVQFGGDGSIKRTELGGLTPSRGTDVVGDTVIDKATGKDIRNVGPAIRAGEEAKVVGKETGDLRMTLPKARAGLRALETQHRNVIATIARAKEQVNRWTTGLAGQTLSNLGGTDAANLRTLLNTIKANLGFDKLQDMRDNSPTGGALGQVAVAELEMLQSAFQSVEQSQTGEQLIENLDYLVGLTREMQDNRLMAFDETYARVGGQRPQASPQKIDYKSKYGLD